MKRIALLVDDDYVTNFLLKTSLEKMGIFEHVATADNGENGIELLKAYIAYSLPIPDVIILDLKMPYMDGFRFIEEFGKLNIKKKVQIIISSASDCPDDKEKAKNLGIEYYFIKPWPVSEIVSLVNQFRFHGFQQIT
jgi:CheY-like chemotaxis protein